MAAVERQFDPEPPQFDHDVIERSLAHVEPNKVCRAYNRYEYWDERVELAQQWADLCDELKAVSVETTTT